MGKTKLNNNVVQQMRKTNDKFAKPQSELVVTKRVNKELHKLIVIMERQCRANAQYYRIECSEVFEITRQVTDSKLETKVLSVFDPAFTDDCHCLGKNNHRFVVNFKYSKDCKQIVKVKKDLRDLNMEKLYLPKGTKNIYKPKIINLLADFMVQK